MLGDPHGLWFGNSAEDEYLDAHDGPDYSYCSGFERDPLHYHTNICYIAHDGKIIHETEKAILYRGRIDLSSSLFEFWIPKKLIKYKEDLMYVWRGFKPTFKRVGIDYQIGYEYCPMCHGTLKPATLNGKDAMACPKCDSGVKFKSETYKEKNEEIHHQRPIQRHSCSA